MKKNNKTACLHFRLTEKEYATIKSKLGPHNTMSRYIRSALTEFDDKKGKARMELATDLLAFFEKHDAELTSLSCKFNDKVRIVNEVALRRRLRAKDMEFFTPVIHEVHVKLTEIRKELTGLYDRAMKL